MKIFQVFLRNIAFRHYLFQGPQKIFCRTSLASQRENPTLSAENIPIDNHGLKRRQGVVAATVFGVPFAMSACGADPAAACGSLMAGAVCGYLLAYAALAGAMPAMLRHLGEPSRVALVIGPACALVLTAMVAEFWGLTITGPFWIGAVAAMAWMLLWAAAGWRLRSSRPDAFASIGAHAGTVRSEVWRGYLRGSS